MAKLARNTPDPYRIPPVIPTTRGPLARIQRPPANAAKPKVRIAIVKVRVTSEILQPKPRTSGVRNTLQA